MSDKGGTTGGVGFTSLLQLLFIALKLLGHIEWSWWWVLAPTWMTVLLAILVIIIAVQMDGD